MYLWLQSWLSRSGEPLPVAAEPGAADAPVAPADAGKPAAAPWSGVSFEQKDQVDTNYYGWLFDTREEVNLDITLQEKQVLAALEKILESQQSGADMVRRLPGLIPQLLHSLRSDNFSGAQIARRISDDAVLVAAVIRLANNANHHGGNTIRSVEHAVIVIGQEGLRQLITTVAFRPIIDLHSGYFTRMLAPRIWDQSERCAIANRVLAEPLGTLPFEAFLVGLVQNVGLIVSLRMMDQIVKDHAKLGSALFCASLLRNARLLSCRIAQEWNFPEPVTLAIREQLSMRKGVTMSPLGQLLSITDYLSKIHVLSENSRLPQHDPSLFNGLPGPALQCYRDLNALGDTDPVGRPA